MPVYPRARQNRVSFESQLPTMAPRAVFVHTNGGGTGPPGVGLTEWFDRLWTDPSLGCAGQGIGATFQVFSDGQVDQLVDSTRVIFAQFAASRWSGAIETEDDGNPATPWTAAQLDALVDLLTWYGRVHQVPMRLMANPDDAGVGYHQQFPQWNLDGHLCPGPVRSAQLIDVVIPRCQQASASTGEEFVLDSAAAEALQGIADQINRLGNVVVHGNRKPDGTPDPTHYGLDQLHTDMGALLALPGRLEAVEAAQAQILARLDTIAPAPPVAQEVTPAPAGSPA